MRDVDSGGGRINIYVRAEGSWEISVSSQFCYEPKTALNMRSILKKGLIFFFLFLFFFFASKKQFLLLGGKLRMHDLDLHVLFAWIPPYFTHPAGSVLLLHMNFLGQLFPQTVL